LLGALPFGAPEIDDALPWRGLALGALHEISGPSRDAAALGFVSALLARLAARAPGVVLWCRRRGASYESGDIYAPGLAAFGLDPSRLILLGAKQGRDVLWAMREGLSCPRLLAVVGEVEDAAVGLTASRRLQLAAEKSGVGCFLLRRVPPEGGQLNNAPPKGGHSNTTPGNAEEPSAALSRWHVRAAPSGPVPGLEAAPAAQRWLGPGRLRWHAELRRCRAAASREWLVEWHHETGNFTVAAPLCDRSVEQTAAGLAI
jgi:protein ImuA